MGLKDGGSRGIGEFPHAGFNIGHTSLKDDRTTHLTLRARMRTSVSRFVALCAGEDLKECMRGLTASPGWRLVRLSACSRKWSRHARYDTRNCRADWKGAASPAWAWQEQARASSGRR